MPNFSREILTYKYIFINFSNSLIEESGSLKYLDSVNWKDEFIKKSVVNEEYSDLPF